MTDHRGLDLARRALAVYRLRQDGSNPEVVTLPSDALPELARAIATATITSALQVIPFFPQDWDVDDYVHLIWRQVAAQGREVKRLYLLPHRGISSDLLDTQTGKDREAGIIVKLLPVADMPQGLAGAGGSQNLWIVDDALIVRDHKGLARMAGAWWVSTRETDLETARQGWEALWRQVDIAETTTTSLDLEEPLALSADVLASVAPVLCTRDHIDRSSCAWYHGAWQYLRLLDLVSTPTWHAGFYTAALERALRDGGGPSQTLITGTADYSLCAYVLAGYRALGLKPAVTVLDLCPTPLFACRWYANWKDVDVRTLEADVLDLSDSLPGSFHVITSDAFLTRFQEPEISRVLSVWRILLKPGGTLVTTVRIHSLAMHARDEEDEIQDFADRARQRAERWRWFLRRTPEEIRDVAERYARRMSTYTLGSEEIILERFRQSGFRVESAELGAVPGELRPTTYLRLVATTDGHH